jgi:hypothetical protein
MRFWRGDSFHPKYFELIPLLDQAVSELLLCPTPYDASLNSIRALMLYLQWMPCSPKETSEAVYPGSQTNRTKVKTRYNDMSAWAVFGMALRYASFLNLERQALAPFRSKDKTAPAEEDIDRMRTWLNLITYDCNLTLTSGLPVSINPAITARVVPEWLSHRMTQDPGDIRYAALIELACIVQRAKNTDDGGLSRHPTVVSLKKANVEMEEWERYVKPD